MKNKFLKLKTIILFLLLSNVLSAYSQDCKPTIVSKDGSVEYFGGKVRDLIGLITDDKSSYSFYIAQINKGKDGTVAFVTFFESVKDREVYNKAINDYLTEEKLKTSFIEIQINNNFIRIPTSNCILEPNKTMGDIYGYTVNLEGWISKEQVIFYKITIFKNSSSTRR
jgi:hypothetical protein